MGKLTVTTFVSLDGVMQAPGGANEDPSSDFTLGGWVVPHFDEQMLAFMNATFQRAEAFLLGRRTYEIFAGYWPKANEADDPIARALNGLPKHVATTTGIALSWQHAQRIDGDVPAAVRRLKASYPGELQVHGSCGLIQTLWAHDLIDELAILQFPAVLGSGHRLFGPGARPMAMKLLQSTHTAAGLLISTYRRDGALRTGQVEPLP